jgi:uncharacterized protein YpmB
MNTDKGEIKMKNINQGISTKDNTIDIEKITQEFKPESNM